MPKVISLQFNGRVRGIIAHAFRHGGCREKNSNNDIHIREKPQVYFKCLIFSDQNTIKLDANDVIVFVGPNNAGKTASLREIQKFIGSSTPQNVIHGARCRKDAPVTEIRNILAQKARKTTRDDNITFEFVGQSYQDAQLEHSWDHNLSFFRSFLCNTLNTESRLIDSDPQYSISPFEQAPSHPLHQLYADEAVEARVSEFFRRAFGKDLIVYRLGGKRVHLLVGE